jgi:hypothetical protein
MNLVKGIIEKAQRQVKLKCKGKGSQLGESEIGNRGAELQKNTRGIKPRVLKSGQKGRQSLEIDHPLNADIPQVAQVIIRLGINFSLTEINETDFRLDEDVLRRAPGHSDVIIPEIVLYT